MAARSSYRSSPAQIGRFCAWLAAPLLFGSSVYLFAKEIRETGHVSGAAWAAGIGGSLIAVCAVRVSLCVLVVSDEAIKIVNWFKTYRIARAGGLLFAFGNDVPNAGFIAGDRTHVVLCVDPGRTINIAALTLGNTNLGVDQVHQMVDDLNARMRTWDTAKTTPSEAK